MGLLIYNTSLSEVEQFAGIDNWVIIDLTGGGGGTGDLTNPMTEVGDLIVGGTAGAATRLPVNTAASVEVLTSYDNNTDWLSFNTLLLANNITPSLNFVGTFDHEPTQIELGSNWVQNALYKNSTDGNSYILTGSPLAWVVYVSDGFAFYLTVESTNGTAFKVGESSTTILKARLFRNGAEITDVAPAQYFFWRRVSAIPQPIPNDDATWNAIYSSGGQKELLINVDSVHARATFFCDIKV